MDYQQEEVRKEFDRLRKEAFEYFRIVNNQSLFCEDYKENFLKV